MKKYLKKNAGSLIFAIVFAIAYAGAFVGISLLLQEIVDFSPWKGVFDFGRNAVLLLTKGKGEISLR
ncbi:hypothetical protein [Butyrivibrio sp. VCB2006]|uniref:hypothetical protein n=1 Tax=Butyrivibrio sp. VCB2006 TaxID=1280679 RepID=UPI0003F4FFE6|nr:hypothetical protein [Butyrivibrio sp. VCB2006]